MFPDDNIHEYIGSNLSFHNIVVYINYIVDTVAIELAEDSFSLDSQDNGRCSSMLTYSDPQSGQPTETGM